MGQRTARQCAPYRLLVRLACILSCLVHTRAAVACTELIFTGTGSHQGARTLAQRAPTVYDPAEDDAQQRATLVQLHAAAGGAKWPVPTAFSHAWLAPNTSYCSWVGVTCCKTSPLTLLTCNGMNSVVVLDLAAFGLTGQLPATAQPLPQLKVLNLAFNPGLSGVLPQSWLPPSLLWLSVLNTSLSGCTGGAAAQVPSSCTGPQEGLQWATNVSSTGSAVTCPALALRSFAAQTQNLPPTAASIITTPFAQPSTPGLVQADASFSNGQGCFCADGGTISSGPAGTLQCIPAGSSTGGDSHTKWVIIVVLVAIVPHLLVALAIFLYVKHRAYLHQLVQFKEAELQHKRGKVPGTPGLVLRDGKGLVPLADTMVTWVCTDVAGSTALWEWDAGVMDSAIDLHNRTLRDLLYEFGGHEIRTEGDSFVISFHEALDGVRFCLKAQERLQAQTWPKGLAQQPATATVTLGDLLQEPRAAGKGQVVMAGLRVRMGINTGMPEDVFLHDLTEHIDYRGVQYDLTAEICDLAQGGQILMGPKTYLSWMRNSGDQGLEHLAWTEPAWHDGSQMLGGHRSILGASSFRASVLQRQLGADSHGFGSPFSSGGNTGGSGSVTHTVGEPSFQHQPSGARTSFKTLASHLAPWGANPSLTALRILSRNHPASGSWGQGSSPCCSPSHTQHVESVGVARSVLGPQEDVSARAQLQTRHSAGEAGAGVGGGSPRDRGSLCQEMVAGQQLGAGAGMVRLALANPDLGTDPGSPGKGRTQISLAAHDMRPASTASFGAMRRALLLGTADQGSSSRLGTAFIASTDLDSRAAPDRGGLATAEQARTGGGAERAGQTLFARCLECVQSSWLCSDDDIPWETDLAGPSLVMAKGQPGDQKNVAGISIDMGFYEWDPSPAHRQTLRTVPDGQDAQEQQRPSVVHLVQVLPSSLAARALLFDWPMVAANDPHWEKISPGFFDAPGSWSLTFPGMREILLALHLPPERPKVALAFTSIEGAKELAAINLLAAQDTVALHNACVRETLSACAGYECKESEGSFVIAFTNAATALEWALTLQLALLCVPWQPEGLSAEVAKEVWEGSKLIFSGPRVRVGVYAGSVDRVTPNIKTGRADYFGQPVNRAARLMSAAHGGQVVCDQALMQEVFSDWAARYGAEGTAQGSQPTSPTGPLATSVQLTSRFAANLVESPKALKSAFATTQFQRTDSPAQSAGGAPRRTSGHRPKAEVHAAQPAHSRRTVTWSQQEAAGGDAGSAGTGSTTPTPPRGRNRSRRQDPGQLSSNVRVARSYVHRSRSRSRLLAERAVEKQAQALDSPEHSNPPSVPMPEGSSSWLTPRSARDPDPDSSTLSQETTPHTTSRLQGPRSGRATPPGMLGDLGGLVTEEAVQQVMRVSGGRHRRASSVATMWRSPSRLLNTAEDIPGDVRMAAWDPNTRGRSSRRPSTSAQPQTSPHSMTSMHAHPMQAAHTPSQPQDWQSHTPASTSPRYQSWFLGGMNMDMMLHHSTENNAIDCIPAYPASRAVLPSVGTLHSSGKAHDSSKGGSHAADRSSSHAITIHSNLNAPSSDSSAPNTEPAQTLPFRAPAGARSNLGGSRQDPGAYDKPSSDPTPLEQYNSRYSYPWSNMSGDPGRPTSRISRMTTDSSIMQDEKERPSLEMDLSQRTSAASQRGSGGSTAAAIRAAVIAAAAHHAGPPVLASSAYPSTSDIPSLPPGRVSYSAAQRSTLGDWDGSKSSLGLMPHAGAASSPHPATVPHSTAPSLSPGLGVHRGVQLSSNGGGSERSGASPISRLSSRTLEHMGLARGSHADGSVTSGSRVAAGRLRSNEPPAGTQPSSARDRPAGTDSQSLPSYYPASEASQWMLDWPSSNPRTRRGSALDDPSSGSRWVPQVMTPDYASMASTSFSSHLNMMPRHVAAGWQTSQGALGMAGWPTTVPHREPGNSQGQVHRSQESSVKLQPIRLSSEGTTSTPHVSTHTSQQLVRTDAAHGPSRRSTKGSVRSWRALSGGSRNSRASTPQERGIPASPSPTNNADGGASAEEVMSGVIAECYKISRSATLEEGGPLPPSTITLIKYKRAGQSQDGGAAEDAEGSDEDEDLQPRAARVIPTVPVEVSVWSLGTFRLKGVAQLMKVVQLVPLELEKRIEYLQKGMLDKGKARCVQRLMVREATVKLPLPDVSKLPCCEERPSGPTRPGAMSMHRSSVGGPPGLRPSSSVVLARNLHDSQAPASAATRAALRRHNSIGVTGSGAPLHGAAAGAQADPQYGQSGGHGMPPVLGQAVSAACRSGAGSGGSFILGQSAGWEAFQTGHRVRRSSAPHCLGSSPLHEQSLAPIHEQASPSPGSYPSPGPDKFYHLQVTRSVPHSRLSDLRPPALEVPTSPTYRIPPLPLPTAPHLQRGPSLQRPLVGELSLAGPCSAPQLSSDLTECAATSVSAVHPTLTQGPEPSALPIRQTMDGSQHSSSVTTPQHPVSPTARPITYLGHPAPVLFLPAHPTSPDSYVAHTSSPSQSKDSLMPSNAALAFLSAIHTTRDSPVLNSACHTSDADQSSAQQLAILVGLDQARSSHAHTTQPLFPKVGAECGSLGTSAAAVQPQGAAWGALPPHTEAAPKQDGPEAGAGQPGGVGVSDTAIHLPPVGQPARDSELLEQGTFVMPSSLKMEGFTLSTAGHGIPQNEGGGQHESSAKAGAGSRTQEAAASLHGEVSGLRQVGVSPNGVSQRSFRFGPLGYAMQASAEAVVWPTSTGDQSTNQACPDKPRQNAP